MNISTIIPAYNCEPFLRRAVDSLIATGVPGLEIIVIDDGSSDGTLRLARQLESESSAVRVLTHPRGVNRGVSATRNLGIESSRGELIAFLDADDYVFPWRFESAMRILNSDNSVDGVHQLSEVVFSDGESASRWWGGETKTFGYTEPVGPEEILFTLLKGCCWAMSAIVVRRSLLAETGLFPIHLKTSEDCHLWFRMAACGRIVSGDLSQPVSAYYRHVDSAFQPSARNRLTMIRTMASFDQWMRRRNPGDPRLGRVSKSIADYILNGIVQARGMGNRALAWQMASWGVVWFPSLLSYRRLYGHVSRMALLR